MSLSIGIVGLANVGKSTLFNALLKESKAVVSNYPFCTIEPNVGVIKVPDTRLDELQELLKVPKKIPAPVKFIDIAGLIKGAHKGEGLGNQFLANIREADALAIVLRAFADSKITSTQKEINPQQEFETIKTELILKDIETCQKRVKSLKKEIKSGDKLAKMQFEIIKKTLSLLDENKLAQDASLNREEHKLIKDLNLLTLKPMLAVLNCDEKDLKNPPFIPDLPEERQIEIAVKTEAELADLSENEQQEYLNSLGLAEPSLNRLIRASYHLLNLITFYTFTSELVQAWPIPKNTPAPNAGSVVHTDFEKKFIKAQVIACEDLKNTESYEKAKSAGKIRVEGKKYEIQDGDVVKFII